jgi:hypothetical protein
MSYFSTPQINNEPPEGIESGGPLSTLGDFAIPTTLGDLPVCVNVRPLPRSDGYNHAVQVANNTIRTLVAEEVERTLQTFLNSLSTPQTYQNTPPRQDPNGLQGIQSHQLVRPTYTELRNNPETAALVLLKPENNAGKHPLRSRFLNMIRWFY